jgi:hypothetical protein
VILDCTSAIEGPRINQTISAGKKGDSMKTRDQVFLIFMVLGASVPVGAQSKPDIGRDIPGPMTPRPHPGLPEEMPLPPTSRPAEIIEEKMVISPTDVRRAQQALRAKGLNPGDDGKLDEETQEALAKFQKQNSLPATGLLDDKTLEKLSVDLHREK